MPSQEIKEPRAERSGGTTAGVSVLLIAPSFDILGGQAVQASQLTNVLNDVPGQEVTFFPINPRLAKPLAWIRNIPFLRTAVNVVLYNTRLLFSARRYDILHIFSAALTSYTLWTIPAILYGKLWRKKVIVNYRDGQAEQHIQQWRSARVTLAMADRIVTPSGFLVDVFAKHGIKAQSILNMIDSSSFIYRKRRNLQPTFVTNRILEPLYNVECILRAFKLIQSKYPDASLTIAHDGMCRPGLEKLSHELALKNTRFIGRVAHDKVAELYDAADIYLTTPNIDCMPGSLLECFASGLPVVATNAGGIPYIAKDRHTALLVNINDHQALAARSCELLENEQLVEDLTANAREEVQRYDWRLVRDQWSELYREVMNLPTAG